MRTNIFAFQTWKNTSVAAGQSSAGHQWEGVVQGKGYIQINDYRVWAERAKCEERICKEKSLTELSVLV